LEHEIDKAMSHENGESKEMQTDKRVLESLIVAQEAAVAELAMTKPARPVAFR